MCLLYFLLKEEALNYCKLPTYSCHPVIMILLAQ